mgnify:FL=1|jgi:hypothetical protein|tara:strand:- start:984 stop:1361 length:378 start_codon:yes stop_codon:yes gene_type:complete
MEDYNKFLKDSIDYKKSREDRYKEVSKDALFKASKKKIQTTMIGALSTIEEHFGFLWGFELPEDQLTPEQKHVKSIFEDVRAKILDRGNTQIRSLESEFVNYEISKKKYFINLPMAKPKGEEDGK